MNHDADHTRQAFANAMNQSPRGEWRWPAYAKKSFDLGPASKAYAAA